jgi:hypothetical protein
MQASVICVVCQEEVPADSGHSLSCSHSFHTDCIVGWFRRGENSCPVCRDTGSSQQSDAESATSDNESFVSDASAAMELQDFRLFSSRAEVARLVRASLTSVRRASGVRSRPMQRLRVRATRFLKATEEANEARQRANLFLRAHTGPLLSGLKRYNALVRMWGTRERRLRDAALDLYIEHTV